MQNQISSQSIPTGWIMCLPAEVTNMICSTIDVKDILSLRLVSKFWNNVATPFMPRNVKLVFKPESFQRLLNISQNPMIGRQITSLYYEPNTLEKYRTQRDWEETIYDASYMQDNLSYPDAYASRREFSVWRRNLNKLRERPRHAYSESHLKKAYKEYARMYADQSDLRDKGYGLKELSEAMSRLPNITEISMNYSVAIYQRAKGVKNVFSSDVSNTVDDHCGIPFMRTLLLAVFQAGIKLGTLRLGSVDWKFLKQSDDVLERMKSTFRHLTTLELVISTGLYSEKESDIENPTYRKFLRNNTKLADILAAAPILKDLRISFDMREPSCPAELNSIFRGTVWPFLESIALENIDATSEDLDHFFKRHALTLRHIFMDSMKLLDGTWADALEKMSQSLTLKSADFRGSLVGEKPGPDLVP